VLKSVNIASNSKKLLSLNYLTHSNATSCPKNACCTSCAAYDNLKTQFKSLNAQFNISTFLKQSRRYHMNVLKECKKQHSFKTEPYI